MIEDNSIDISAERQILQNLLALDIASEEIERYGVHPDQFIEWYGNPDGKPVCLVHGGIFHGCANVAYLRPAALALGEAGYRVALVEYRYVAGSPDFALADLETLARHPILENAIWVGHSLGAVLVFNILFNPELTPKHAVGLAPIFDLRRDVEEFHNRVPSLVTQWMGGSPVTIPDVYAAFDPAVIYARLGADGFSSSDLRLDIIHGVQDQTVPVNRSHELSGEPFSVALVPEANHNAVVLPGHDAWILFLGALG